MNDDIQTAFVDLPRDNFPLKIEFFRQSDVEGVTPVHAFDVPGPGAIVVPPLSTELGEGIWVRVTFGDGTIMGTSADVPTREDLDDYHRQD